MLCLVLWSSSLLGIFLSCSSLRFYYFPQEHFSIYSSKSATLATFFSAIFLVYCDTSIFVSIPSSVLSLLSLFMKKISSVSNLRSVLHYYVMEAGFENTAEFDDFKQNTVCNYRLDIQGASTRVYTASLCQLTEDPDRGFQRTIHDHALACNEDCNHNSICGAYMDDVFKSQAYPIVSETTVRICLRQDI